MSRLVKPVYFILCVFILSVVASCGGEHQRRTGEYVDDTVLATRVKSALLADPEVSGLDIQVETFRGRVQLSGFADNETQIRRAEEIARRTDGVEEVTNSINLKDERRR
jgi:hyperosmotically inducible periplasmic protein